MKNIYKNKTFLFIFMFAASMLGMLVVSQGNAFAATKTWTGAVDGLWSTGGNWSPAGAPVSGDDLIFDTTAGSVNTTNDIASLSVLSITVNGSNTSTLANENPLTLTGNVTAGSAGIAIFGDIILGANVTFTNVSGQLPISPPVTGTGDSIDLSTFTLTFNGGTASFEQNISGAGNMNIEIDGSEAIYFDGVNTLSGTTTITTGLVTCNSFSCDNSTNIFGTSTIVIKPTASLILRFDETTNNSTFSNTIIIEQSDLDLLSDYDQLMFWNNTSNSSAVTINVPNIILEGDARLSVNDTLGAVTINLAGIQDNGNCVQYGYPAAPQTSNFLNGPTACIVDGTATPGSTATPGTPNTGFGLIRNNPIATMAITTLAALTIAVVARQRIKANKA